MRQSHPIAIGEDGKFAFLRPSPVAGESPTVFSIWEQDEFRFRTFQGRAWELPTADRLVTVCNLNRSKVADHEYNVSVRHAHAVDLNNLAALYICERRAYEAWNALQEAEQQFVAICDSFPKPPAIALLGRAVAMHNASLVHAGVGNYAESETIRIEACEVMAGIPHDDRGFSHGFVAAALGCPKN